MNLFLEDWVKSEILLLKIKTNFNQDTKSFKWK